MYRIKLLSTLKSLSIIFFLLFLIEALVLSSHDFSFRGVYTEKIFFWAWVVIGLIGFGLKRFILGFSIFLILTMIPMMIPFLILLNWSTSVNKAFPLSNGERIERVFRFGQEPVELSVIRPKYVLLEEAYLNMDLYACQINNFEQLVIKSADLEDVNGVSKITIQYKVNDTLQVCNLELKK